MNKRMFSQLTVALTGAAVVVAGVSAPAKADPVSVTKFAELVGLGSDTTMDVMDGISLALGTLDDGRLKLASYKAIGSADVVVGPDGKAVPRANGSSAGRDALRVAIGQLASATIALPADELGKPRTAAVPTTADLAGKIHFGRSSSAPSGAISNGVVTYIPFALDNMTYATAPVSKIPSNIPLGSSGNTSEVSLMNIYKGNITQIILSSADESFIKLAAPSYVPAFGETSRTIKAYIPQAGSGTRAFWISKVGITEANIAAGTTAAKDTYNGLTVQEHDGSALVGDPYALVGFSISQWVAQMNAVSPNRTAGAVLRSMGGVEPVTLSNGVYSTAENWTAISRPVYNMVPTALANSDVPNAITRAFVGTNSLVCQAKTTIQKFGYGLLSYTGADAELGLTPGGQATVCGNITEANRVFAPSTSSVTLDAPVISATGTSAVVRATVASNGNQGGTVTLWSGFGTDNAEVIATGTVPANSTTVEITVANQGESTWTRSLTAQFVPTLAGVNVSNSVVDATSLTLKAPTGVSFGPATVAANGLSASFTATVTGGQAGTLKIYNGGFGGTEVKSVSVSGSTATVTIDQANGEAVNYSLVGEFTPTDSSGFSVSRTAEPVAVSLKNTISAAITMGATVKTSAIPSAAVTVKAGKSSSAVMASGHVFAVIYNSKNVPVASTSAYVKLVAGKATLKFAKLTTVGKYTLKVFYLGSELTPLVSSKAFSVVK
ncbi:MAG: hypothetical protein RLZZ556_572 [Actinomycetota bacterium]